MFVSYLSGEASRTEYAIQYILQQQGNNKKNENSKSNYCFCLLDGDVIRDDGLVQRTFKLHMHRVSRKRCSTSNRQEQAIRAIDHVESLAQLTEETALKFLTNFTPTSITTSTSGNGNNSIYISLPNVVREFNRRIEHLCRMLTREEFGQIGWPIGEFVIKSNNSNGNNNETTNSSSENCNGTSYSRNELLKYWNTPERFALIRTQFY